MKTKKATWLALLASVLTFASGVLAWETKIHGSFADNSANAAVVDVEGNIIAAGYLAAVDGSSLFTVVKLSGIDGTELWRQSLTGVAGAAYSIALDRGFDVVAAGITFMPGNVRGFTVAKFSGIDGSESWRRIIIGSDPGPFANFNVANSVSVDEAGNVVAAGYTTDRFFNWSHTVIKFSGTDGEELWRQLIHGTSDRPGQDQAFAVTVGPAGNGASAGWVDTASDTVSKFTVVSTAVEGWVQFVEGSDHTLGAWNTAFAVSLDALGNVVAAGSLQNTTPILTSR